MYNKLFLICKYLENSHNADSELANLLMEQYHYGRFNTDYDRECRNYINRCIKQYKLDILPI